MRRICVLLAATTLVAGCGGGKSESNEQASGPPLQTLNVSEKEFSITPASMNVTKPGTYEFQVTNDGQIGHALEIEGHGAEAKTDTIDPGSSATLKVDLSKAGSYEVYCPIDDHENKGMKATLTVGGAAAPGVGGTQSSPTSTGMTTTGGTTTQQTPGY